MRASESEPAYVTRPEPLATAGTGNGICGNRYAQCIPSAGSSSVLGSAAPISKDDASNLGRGWTSAHSPIMRIFHRNPARVRQKKGRTTRIAQIFTAHRRVMIESRNAPGGRRFRTIQFRPKERSVVPWYADSVVGCLAVVTLWAGGRPMFDTSCSRSPTR